MDTSDVILLIILISITVIISIFYVIIFISLRKKYKEIYKARKEKKSELQFNDKIDIFIEKREKEK